MGTWRTACDCSSPVHDGELGIERGQVALNLHLYIRHLTRLCAVPQGSGFQKDVLTSQHALPL